MFIYDLKPVNKFSLSKLVFQNTIKQLQNIFDSKSILSEMMKLWRRKNLKFVKKNLWIIVRLYK